MALGYDLLTLCVPNDRLGGSSNCVGKEGRRPSDRGFERYVEFSVTRWQNPGNDQLACRETGIHSALSDKNTILTYDIQRPHANAGSAL